VSGFGAVETVFVDRDGVINRKAPEGEYVWRWEDFHVLPGVDAAIARLNAEGRRVFVVTNQRGAALGLYTPADIEALHARFSEWLTERGARIDAFYYCPHDREGCRCRKPDTGMMEQAFAEHGGEAATSIMIGDSLSDIEAGRKAGMRTIWIDDQQTSRKPGTEKAASLADAVCGSLPEAVRLLDPLPES
jgi:D-glycero-D-manno-heptose 1,7-bisphosphate phosphatase